MPVHRFEFRATFALAMALAVTGIALTGAPSRAMGPPVLSVTNGAVEATLLVGNVLYIGGNFTVVGGESRNAIAALDVTTGLPTAWNPNIQGAVYALASNGTTVYAAGAIFTVGGQPCNHVVAIDATTGLATAWNPNANFYAYSLALSGTTVYVGGLFNSIGGRSCNGIAALDATTGLVPSSWNTFPAPGGLGAVRTLVLNGNTLYAGGYFSSLGGQSRNGIAALNSTTGLATSWNPAPDFGGVRGLAVNGNTVYAGGAFTSIGGQARSRIAALDATTGLATAWNPDADGSVNTITVSGATAYAAGYFTSIGGQPWSYVAALELPDITAPSVPTPFTGVFSGGPAQLHWGANTEADFAAYHLYRDTTEDFVPGPGNLVASQSDTGYVDAGSTWSYYKLSALDVVGNESGFALVIPASQFAAGTPAGSPVQVPLGSNVQVNFANVSSGGVTELTMQTGGQSPPNGLKVAPGSPKLYYLLTTTASFTGPVMVCVTYDPANVSGQESNLKMMHYDTAQQPPGWVDVTASRDVVANVICGTVTHFSEFALMEADPTVDVKDEGPASVQLYSCAPNPVLGSALIRFDLSAASPVRLGVFDLQGRLVRDLERQAVKGAGRYVVHWDGRGEHGEQLRAGIYFIRLEAGKFLEARRVVVMR